MKRHLIMSIAASFFLCPILAFAQCGTSLINLSYDTILRGGGNNTFVLSFPKFDGALGTLTEVRLSSVINMSYQFTLENDNPVTANNYEAYIGRRDRIFLEGAQISNAFSPQVPFGPFTLAPSDSMTGSGDDFVSIPPTIIANDYNITSNHSNVAQYLGSGNVELHYTTSAITTFDGLANVDFKSIATDSIHFTITYVYCQNLVLPADITNFSIADRSNTLEFRWVPTLDTKGKTFEIQRSYDGFVFSPVIVSLPKNATNAGTATQCFYELKSTDIGYGIFRLKQTDADGTIKYSPLRVIKLSNKISAAVAMFPNPTRGETQFVFNNTKFGNWKLDLFATNGKVISSRIFKNAMVARINSNRELPKGIYFVKATNLDTWETVTRKLLIQ